jgi:hypothetical protein
MHHVTVEGSLQKLLNGVKETVEIRDSSGKILGHFTPVLSPEEADLYARAAELFDLEELDRIAATERTGYTIEQVMEYLQSLEKSR